MLALGRSNSSSSPLIPRPSNVSGGKAVARGALEMSQQQNLTTSGMVVVVLPMTLGIVSNIVALFILVHAYSLQRRRSKATFLLFATSLVVTDFMGHLIPGALVLRLYISGGVRPEDSNSPDALCQFLGGSMVFFGLCPLFLGCAMAAERCLGVTKPLLHSSLVTTTHVKMCLSVIWLAALCVALLPCFGLGSYAYQDPGTWCFIQVLSDIHESDVAFVLLFSGLGLTSLAAAVVCNSVSGLTLVLARLRRKPGSHHPAKSHDIEMVVQLLGITVTSCICWCPLLIFGPMSAIHSYNGPIEEDLPNYKMLLVMGVRLATWNQILDPWVYILLRRTVLRKIYLIAKCQAGLGGNFFSCLDTSSPPQSEKNEVNQV
ncbi:prostaglandin F2-alpha receptor-like isoform X2 [Corythoichthys intestinalis]|nr:prostaglandin F2-alpha receptor-like isoform X2 [Corythoichthys intestinalis]XP_057698377.1 prostaglandin F2-alpha receptor-like isoform X2 [Corythoichthys intestinalis]XP_057698378.1 prostaglandin F2-alpha receptor-like isoform X2 [Corythoichthys intestinalis]XP_061791857.1 prostaglandin F2-alpha receptor-like [Nerophis lumbriciformis]